MTNVMPILAKEATAAKLLDMTPTEFRRLVDAGHLPRGKEIAPGFVRWDVEMLRMIACGNAVDGMEDIKW